MTSHGPCDRNKPLQWHRCDGPRPPCSRRHQLFSLLVQVFTASEEEKKKTGVGPSITSYISVSNLMPRCEWILKQAKKRAPPPLLPSGKACTRPPRPAAAAAGLNKYVAEGTCWQLGPRYGRRCLCCGFARAPRRKQLGRRAAFPG